MVRKMWGTKQLSPNLDLPVIPPRGRIFFDQIVDVVKPSVIVEFGSWEGSSALAWCRAAKRASIDMHLYCIDTWLGSPEHWSDQGSASEWSHNRLLINDGEPFFIETFRKAVLSNDLQQQISPVRASTECGSIFLKRQGIAADLVYIDADHSFEAVSADLQYAASILSAHGIITGDDWHYIPIKKAVLKYA